jgi:hypothetical protein
MPRCLEHCCRKTNAPSLRSAVVGMAMVAMLVSDFAGAQDLGRRSFDQDAMFSAVGAMYGLDPALLKAIAMVESHGDPAAVSPAGALGLMQLMPATAERFLTDDPFDPVENALGAARFLCYLKRDPRIRANLPKLLAAYNAGEGAVGRYDGVPPYPETREYVRRVLWLYFLGEVPARQTGKGGGERIDLGRRTVTAPAVTRIKSEHNEDSAMLKQLAELRRQRAEAAAAPGTGTVAR